MHSTWPGLAGAVALAVLVVAPSAAEDAVGPTVEPAPAAATAPPPELTAFFRETDAGKRAAMVETLAARLEPFSDATSLGLRQSFPFETISPGVHAYQTPAQGDLPAVSYVVGVPANYDPRSATGVPLVLGLHGTGGTAQGHLQAMSGWLGEDSARVLVACPQAPDGGPFAFTKESVLAPRAVVDDVRRRFNVDSNRVVISGFSRGGYVTWAAALFSPGEWAAAVPMGAFPLTGAGRHGIDLYLENVLGLTVQYHWGDQDSLPGQAEGINTFARRTADRMATLKAERFESVCYEGQGHGIRVDGVRVRTCIAAARRTPWPDAWQMTFHHVWEGRGPNVRALRGSKDELDFRNLPPVRANNEAEARTAMVALLRGRACRMQVHVVRATNSLIVRTQNLARIEVLLSPQHLDFGRPVRVIANGVTATQERREVDWGLLLETVRTSGDFDRLVGGRVEITLQR